MVRKISGPGAVHGIRTEHRKRCLQVLRSELCKGSCPGFPKQRGIDLNDCGATNLVKRPERDALPFCRSNVVQDTNSGNRTLSDLFAANQLVNRFRSCLSCFDAYELRPPLALHPGFRQWPRLPKQRCVHGILDECGTSKIRIRTALLLNQLP